MKENSSFLKLAVRNTFLKFLALSVFVCLVQAGIFAALTSGGAEFENAWNSPLITAVAGIGLTAAMLLLTVPWAMSGGSRPAMTLQRLGITNLKAVCWIVFYNSACIVIYWAAQLAVVLLLSELYLTVTGASGHLHLISLAAWRVSLFHMLLPVGDLMQLARDIVLVITLGMMSGALSVCETSVRLCVCAALTARAVISAATDGAGVTLFACILEIAIAAALIICWYILTREACLRKDEPREKKPGRRRKAGIGPEGKEETA